MTHFFFPPIELQNRIRAVTRLAAEPLWMHKIVQETESLNRRSLS